MKRIFFTTLLLSLLLTFSILGDGLIKTPVGSLSALSTGTVVKISGDRQIVECSEGDQAVGVIISFETYSAAPDSYLICSAGIATNLRCANAVVAGDKLVPANLGRVQPIVADPDGHVIGTALSSAPAGGTVDVLLNVGVAEFSGEDNQTITTRDGVTGANAGTSGNFTIDLDLTANGGLIFSGAVPARTIGVEFGSGSNQIARGDHNHQTLSRGAGLTGSNYDGSSPTSWAVNFGTIAGSVAEGNHTHTQMHNRAHSFYNSSDHSDVSVSGLATGDLLRWNGSNWANYPASNFSLSTHSHATLSPSTGLTGTNYDGSSNSTWALNFGTGTNQVARGDHGHTNMITGTGTATRVAFWNGVNSITSGANLYWDSPNNRLGIGTTNPTERLHIDGSIVTQNGQVKRDFATFNTTSSSPTAIHIETNITWSNLMYRILVEGYNYGAAQPINSEVVGYTAAASPSTITNAGAIDHSTGASISQYKSGDGYLVVKLTHPSTFYYAGFSVSAWLTNPNGFAFDIKVIRIIQQAADLIPFVPGSQTFNYTGGVQTFTVPTGVTTVTIEAWGAQGGNGYYSVASAGGYGAYMKGTFSVTAGENLTINVGGMGVSGTGGLHGGGGGGGSFVKRSSTPLLVAGGGGGGSYQNDTPGSSGLTSTTGGLGGYPSYPRSPGDGGFSDNGGGGGCGAGGGGWLYAGTSNSWAGGGQAAGGSGGTSSYSLFGGFGGGGGAFHGGGGGGGYTGGNGGSYTLGGGGGGSYCAGTLVTSTSGARAGNGQVVISW